MQEGWERCREAESKETLRSVQGGFQKCRDREAKSWTGCRQKYREAGNSAGRREAYGWQRSLARCRSRKEAVNKAAQAPLVPMGAGLGHRLGSLQGSRGGWTQGSSQQEEKSWNAGQSPSLIHCGRGKGGTDRDSGWGETRKDKGEVGRTNRREQGQGLVKLPLPTLPFLPACPRPPLTA